MAIGGRHRDSRPAAATPPGGGIRGDGLGADNDGRAAGDDDIPDAVPPQATRAIRLTRWALWWEAAARAFWPAFVWAVAGVSGLALGLGDAVPRAGLPWISAGWALLLCGLLLWGLWRLRRPRRGDARARVDATLPGRPLASLRDALAVGVEDGGSTALWRAHLAQMARVARAARPVRPRAGLAARDPLGLRLMAMTALSMALLFGSGGRLGEGLSALASTFRGPMPHGADTTAPGWEGWASPPDYTRRATIYLNALPQDETLHLPKGSRVSFRLYGEGSVVDQTIGAPVADAPPDAPVFTAEHSGRIVVAGRAFPVEVQPDAPPVIAAGAAPQRRADGRLVQRFQAGDDNGVTTAQASITLDLGAVDRRYGLATEPDPRAPVILDLPLPARGTRTGVQGTLVGDLARHPWANLPVTVSLSARDGIDQQGTAPPMHTVLPGRRFFDPLAAALIEVRRDLLWSRANDVGAAMILRAITWQPQGLMDGDLPSALADIVARLEGAGLTEAGRDQIAQALWDAAVVLEDGGLADALEAMQRAQQRLSEAIRNGATPDEIARLMDDLKAATKSYTDMLAEQGEADPNERFVRQQPSQTISGDQIQKMMDEIERLMNEGKLAEAEALLDQFNRMMQNLKVTQGEGQGDGTGQQSRQRLADTLRQQQRLADEALRQLQDSFTGPPGADRQEGQPAPGAGQGGEPAAGPQAGAEAPGDLAGQQRALREDLGRQRGLLPGPGTPEGEAAGRQLDRAGRAMQQAEEALGQQDPGAAMDRQAEAIEALREGLRALGRQDGPDEGQGTGSAQAEGSPGGDRPGGAGTGPAPMPYLPRPPTDPLGRETAGGGSTITTGDPLSEGTGDPARRAHDLLDEIRRRTGQSQRPADERDYLRRLLDQF